MQIVHNNRIYNISELDQTEDQEILKEGFSVDKSMVGAFVKFCRTPHLARTEVFADAEIIPYNEYRGLVDKTGLIKGIYPNISQFPSYIHDYFEVDFMGKTYLVNPMCLKPYKLPETQWSIDMSGLKVGKNLLDGELIYGSLGTTATQYEPYTIGIDWGGPQPSETVEINTLARPTVVNRFDELESKVESLLVERNDFMKILNLWKKREIEKIEKEFNDTKARIVEEDESTEYKNQLKEMKENIIEDYKERNITVDIKIEMNGFTYSQETLDKLEEAKADMNESIAEINELYEEVEARLELCETEESKIKVLKAYDILSKDGKLA